MPSRTISPGEGLRSSRLGALLSTAKSYSTLIVTLPEVSMAVNIMVAGPSGRVVVSTESSQ